jgi:cyclomaltodextrinase
MDPDGDGDPSDGIDGWRLDVRNEVALPFWREWRALVKSINPDAFISGEIWDRADTWLDGRHFDSVMNYRFADAVLAWVGHEERKISASECERRLAELRLAYPREANLALMNLVDSHDTDRVASMLNNPDREYDQGNREQDGAGYDAGKPGPLPYRRARLLALLQMTYVGAPMIFYGDEAGMWGADDPANRKPMLWKDLEPYARGAENHVDEDHLEQYAGRIGLRRGHAALRTGSYRTVLVDDAQDVLAYVREDERELVLVALNASSHEAQVELSVTDGSWRAIHGDDDWRTSEGSVRIPAIEGRVWVKKK